MKYRPEIDGLRAVAVVPVILFHAGFKHFSGGFIGVDIFFVISGYLITTIILSEMNKGTFSIINFYERRSRRILPALFVVMLFSMFFSWLWLFPSDMISFSKSLIAVSTFSSNILFWRETGYWGAANELKPLLHTWSLAVEEQYYVLFPLFLMGMWQFRKRWIFSSFLIIAALSLLISQWGAYNKPTAAFFLLPTRGWELAVGATIAFYLLYRNGKYQAIFNHKPTAESLSWLGLLMIGYSVFVFDETVPFPSFFALIPTIGTGLIILFSSDQTSVGRLLGSRIPTGIGLISYSAYLWHQPLLAFARHRSYTEPSQLLFLVLVFSSFILAYISWKYVESPFRKKDNFSRKTILIFTGFGSLAFIAIGIAGQVTDGFNKRATQSGDTLESIEKRWAINHGLSQSCNGDFTLSPECRTAEDPEILIWGDSFAMHLVEGVLASKPDAKIIQMTKSSCGPFFDVSRVTLPDNPVGWAKECLDFNQKVRQWIQENKSVKYAVLSSPFYTYISEEHSLLFRDGELVQANIHRAAAEFDKTLNELKSYGITPIIFSPPPTNGNNLGRCLAQAEWNGDALGTCNFPRTELIPFSQRAYDFLDMLDDQYKIVRLDDLICDKTTCKTNMDSTFIYRDKFHLSMEGSALLGKANNFYKAIVGDKALRQMLSKHNSNLIPQNH